MIQVTEVTRQQALGNEYLYVEMASEKHTVLVVVCKGATSYVQVVNQNASNRAWRGMGKRFETADQAIAHYKTPAIQEMIRHALGMAA